VRRRVLRTPTPPQRRSATSISAPFLACRHAPFVCRLTSLSFSTSHGEGKELPDSFGVVRIVKNSLLVALLLCGGVGVRSTLLLTRPPRASFENQTQPDPTRPNQTQLHPTLRLNGIQPGPTRSTGPQPDPARPKQTQTCLRLLMAVVWQTRV